MKLTKGSKYNMCALVQALDFICIFMSTLVRKRVWKEIKAVDNKYSLRAELSTYIL